MISSERLLCASTSLAIRLYIHESNNHPINNITLIVLEALISIVVCINTYCNTSQWKYNRRHLLRRSFDRPYFTRPTSQHLKCKCRDGEFTGEAARLQLVEIALRSTSPPNPPVTESFVTINSIVAVVSVVYHQEPLVANGFLDTLLQNRYGSLLNGTEHVACRTQLFYTLPYPRGRVSFSLGHQETYTNIPYNTYTSSRSNFSPKLSSESPKSSSIISKDR